MSQDFLYKMQKDRSDIIDEMLQETYSEDEVQKHSFESFDPKDAVVWIDPLDGTKSFVEGELTVCTVLIGLSINGKSRFGIIHHPFAPIDQTKGVTFFGSAEHGAHKLYLDYQLTKQQLLRR